MLDFGLFVIICINIGNMQNAKIIPQVKISTVFETSLNGVDLSFANIRESERTKHVHRLHPYLGKFIPQLVEVFLKNYFKKGDFIIDPFMGSGTTLIEANVLGMHSIGIDISEFNCLSRG